MVLHKILDFIAKQMITFMYNINFIFQKFYKAWHSEKFPKQIILKIIVENISGN